MTLAEKTKFGPYEIVMPIGAGGMGEVYRARDTRLGRDVALKVLPEEFAHDAERMARLRREAQVLASLNHPNIAAIYGFEDSGSTHALVMELVEGPTLAERIKQGAIPIDEALLIAKQICEGLEYAHERGIIHRDLKPSNVKVTPDGAVKILDFGLAKAIEGDPSTTSVENSPTLSAMATHAGFLLGTAAYMSPEQARGKKTDRRADIWAFGVVLFEMLSGERLFSGETTSDTLAAVIRAEPDWNELPAQTPPRIRELLHRCLKKDPRQRLQSIGDARITIDEILSGAPEAALLTGARELTSRNKWLRVLPWALVGMLTVALAASFLIFPLAMREPPASVVVSEISAPASTNFVLSGDVSGPPVLSPDGQQLAFTAMGSDGKQQLWVRPLNSATAQALAETDGATYPFWSPDSRSLGYFANGKLNRIDTSGGTAIALADAGNGRGGSWGADGTILFTPDAATPIHRTPASGGTAQLVTKVNASRQEISHRWPQFLPDGKHFLFYARGTDPQSNATYVASVDGGEQKLILRGDSSAVYAAPGYLLFIRQGTLMAQRFDTRELQLAGDAMPLAEHADTNDRVWRGVFTVSENGILAYGVGSSVGANSRLLWFDRSGKQTGETGTPAEYNNPKLSPDGHELAVAMNVAQRTNIWLCDLARGIPTRLTFSSAIDVEPSWSPDGKTIAFMSNRNGQFHLYQKAADGTGSTTPLAVDDGNKYVPDWSSDGRYVLYQRLTAQPGSRLEIWALPLFGDRKAFPVVQNQQFNQTQAALAANGKWLAYMSVETGRPEIYVVPFLRRGGKWEVSTSGGLWPRWRRDGKELFYMSLDYKIVSAEISEVGTSLVIGKVTPLFQTNVWSGPGWSYDVSADGKKFVVVSQVAQQAAGPLTLVTNWPALLKKQQ